MVTIVGVFSLVSSAVVTIHPHKDTHSRSVAQVDRSVSARIAWAHAHRDERVVGKGERRARHTGETTYVFGITAINAVSPVCFALDPPTLVQTSIATLFRNQPSVDFIHLCVASPSVCCGDRFRLFFFLSSSTRLFRPRHDVPVNPTFFTLSRFRKISIWVWFGFTASRFF